MLLSYILPEGLKLRLLLLILLLACWKSSIAETSQSFRSGPKQVHLLELYTSQGCSSCPPAEKWLSRMMDSDDLWKRIIPVNFHVDYWDNLGWPDRYASSKYTQRQYIYKALGNTNVVATPGFVINGQGWSGWFYGHKLPRLTSPNVGELSLEIKDKAFTAKFDSPRFTNKQLTLNIVQLGFGLFDQIKRGENEGKLLRQDFVVLSFQQLPFTQSKTKFSVNSKLVKLTNSSPISGVAAWITADNNPTPIQSVGGYLK